MTNVRNQINKSRSLRQFKPWDGRKIITEKFSNKIKQVYVFLILCCFVTCYLKFITFILGAATRIITIKQFREFILNNKERAMFDNIMICFNFWVKRFLWVFLTFKLVMWNVKHLFYLEFECTYILVGKQEISWIVIKIFWERSNYSLLNRTTSTRLQAIKGARRNQYVYVQR